MTKVFSLIVAIVLISGCATPRQKATVANPGAVTAFRQERLTLKEAEHKVLSSWEENLQKLKARLEENLSPALREQVTTDRDLLEKDLARHRQKFADQVANYNPATDQIWTYRTPALTSDGRGGESGIVLIQKDKITYLWRIIYD